MERVYIAPDQINHTSVLFTVGAKVVVVDGSFMMKKSTDGKTFHVSGLYFFRENTYEVLTIIEINNPVPTDHANDGYLDYQNNCTIQGADGQIYYCSRINIRKIK